MKSHKQYFYEPAGNNLTRVIVIMRKPKPKSYIRRRMWWAWNYKWDHSHYKKYKI
jgi:hypothetical protein